jgi:hypothetical protein
MNYLSLFLLSFLNCFMVIYIRNQYNFSIFDMIICLFYNIILNLRASNNFILKKRHIKKSERAYNNTNNV